ncbi:hypothetical protein EYF80_012618 [Liparis tanakae]|uniref:Uncharacterized protein n=1 Tax=Liparis tanakae TaxID=230148 RepID=A0A4Z2IGK2_9TELE|nr:hypothetical protein EYF80_012618 [Liparis tanakae]
MESPCVRDNGEPKGNISLSEREDERGRQAYGEGDNRGRLASTDAAWQQEGPGRESQPWPGFTALTPSHPGFASPEPRSSDVPRAQPWPGSGPGLAQLPTMEHGPLGEATGHLSTRPFINRLDNEAGSQPNTPEGLSRTASIRQNNFRQIKLGSDWLSLIRHIRHLCSPLPLAVAPHSERDDPPNN